MKQRNFMVDSVFRFLFLCALHGTYIVDVAGLLNADTSHKCLSCEIDCCGEYGPRCTGVHCSALVFVSCVCVCVVLKLHVCKAKIHPSETY